MLNILANKRLELKFCFKLRFYKRLINSLKRLTTRFNESLNNCKSKIRFTENNFLELK